MDPQHLSVILSFLVVQETYRWKLLSDLSSEQWLKSPKTR